MSNKDKIKHLLIEVQKIRLKNQTSSEKLEDYLYYQHMKVANQEPPFFACGLCGRVRNQTSPFFKSAFKALSDIEQANFYLLNVKHLDVILNSEAHKEESICSKTQQEDNNIQVVFCLGSFFKKQVTLNVEILARQKILKITENKIEIDLHHYLLRRSKNKKSSYIVLEATQPGPLGNTIRMNQYGLQFDSLLSRITKLWEEAQKENIVDMLKDSKKVGKLSKLSKPKSSMIEQYLDSQQTKTMVSSETESNKKNGQYIEMTNLQDAKMLHIIHTFTSFDRFQQISYGQFHQKNGPRVRKIIQFSSLKKDAQSVSQIIQQINEIKRRKPTIKFIRMLPNKVIGKSKIQQIHTFPDNNQVRFIYERNQFTYHGSNYIIERSPPYKNMYPQFQNVLDADVQHCIWRIREINNQIQIFVEAKIQFKIKNDKHYKKTRKLVSMYIGQLCKFLDSFQCIQRKSVSTKEFDNQQIQCISEHSQQQNFYTMPGSLKLDQNEEKPQTMQEFMSQQQQVVQSGSEQIDQKDQKLIKFNERLVHHKFIERPTQKNTNIKNEMKITQTQKQTEKTQNTVSGVNNHWLFQNEWVVKQNGDLVNINQQKINVQSSVLKLVVKRISRNLFAGKSILNTSLPIQIFGTDSNLERLVKGYIFAPIFLQQAVKYTNPVQRMAKVICFGVGFSLAYITMEKPFNPILGQTYQGVIDGCPVYGQQISHHPPISSLYMIGRGYKIWGSFQAKVQMGLNTAAGINEGFNYVQFQQNKDIIKFSCPPGELSGLVYGDRKVSVTKKSIYIDQKNRLICQLDWGKNKSSKDPLAGFNDFFSGKIIKLKQNTNFSNYKSLKKEQIEQQMGQITGRFYQKVCFNGQTIFNIEKVNPFEMMDYVPCLMSDSRMRKDIIHRKQNNFTLAQEAKQELQVFQRNDKKLRLQHSKKGNQHHS